MTWQIPSPFCAVLALVCLGAPASPQDIQLSVAGGWYNPGGEDFGDTDSGLGLDGVVRVAIGGQFQLGGGVQWNSHDVDFSSDNYDVFALFVEPRLTFPGASATAAPFIAGRVAWARQSIEITAGDRASTGIGLGGLAGASFALTPAFELETAVTLYYLSFGDFELDGRELPGSDSSGSALGLRLALNFNP